MSPLCSSRCPKCDAPMWTRVTRRGPKCACKDRKLCGFVGDAPFAAPQTGPKFEREATT
jgi:hypothetical protein